jgi:thiamine pyrophosphokinase
MHVGIFTGGELHQGRSVAEVIKQFDNVIAADSGAAIAVSLGMIPDFVIGDLDSIDEKTVFLLNREGTKFEKHPGEKDATDTELAIDFAVKNGATTITILGGTSGNRIDHILANVFLSTQYTVPIYFIDGDSTMWLGKRPEEKIKGSPGDILSLIPLTNIDEITSTGLQYVLESETLYRGKSRSVSNMLSGPIATVKWEKGELFFVHTERLQNNKQ